MSANSPNDPNATFIPPSDADKTTPPPAKKPTPSGSGETKKVTTIGDFKILKKLGQGGMGEVFLAHQISLDRQVALKTLSRELAKKEDFVKRFLREARAMAKIDHVNAVKVYAVDSQAGIHFAAIEYIDGKSMQDWMDQLGQLSIGDALHVILACADALKLAHGLNMIHRDIKPDNILVTSRGVVKVSDFGLAKALDDEDVSMTQSGTGLGTPLYMAPEQARNAKHVDLKTDIYALGTTLYYFLTGKLPFTGENTLQLILAKEKGMFTSARKLNPEIPERLDLMIDKMIAKDPAHRYADCAAVMADLESLELHSPTLSFIDHPNKAVLGRSGPASSGMTSKVGKPAPPASHTTQPNSSPTRQTPPASPALDSNKMWVVQYPDASGKLKTTKLSTDQIKNAIRKGMIDNRAKARDASGGDLLPLAQYPEFDSLITGLLTKASADKKSKDMKSIYDKLDRQERNRKRFRWLRNLADSFKGGVGLIIWLAVLAVIAFAGWKWGWPMIQKMLNGDGA